MRRLARAYGFVRADVLTITASMAVTVRTADDQVITQTRRILRRGTDMRCIEAVNELSRKVCVNPVPPEELHARLGACPHRTDGCAAIAAGVSDHVRLVRCVLRRHLERRHSRHAVQRAAAKSPRRASDRISPERAVLTRGQLGGDVRGSGSHGKNRHGTESGLYHYRQHHAADSGHSVR